MGDIKCDNILNRPQGQIEACQISKSRDTQIEVKHKVLWSREYLP